MVIRHSDWLLGGRTKIAEQFEELVNFWDKAVRCRQSKQFNTQTFISTLIGTVHLSQQNHYRVYHEIDTTVCWIVVTWIKTTRRWVVKRQRWVDSDTKFIYMNNNILNWLESISWRDTFNLSPFWYADNHINISMNTVQ